MSSQSRCSAVVSSPCRVGEWDPEPDRQKGHRPPGTLPSPDLFEQAVYAWVDAYFDGLVARCGQPVGRPVGWKHPGAFTGTPFTAVQNGRIASTALSANTATRDRISPQYRYRNALSSG